VAGRGSAYFSLQAAYNKKAWSFFHGIVLFLGSRGSQNEFMGQLLQGQSCNTAAKKLFGN
jgi:hypothetical protein